jgi:hypothetical protein
MEEASSVPEDYEDMEQDGDIVLEVSPDGEAMEDGELSDHEEAAQVIFEPAAGIKISAADRKDFCVGFGYMKCDVHYFDATHYFQEFFMQYSGI